MSPEPKVLRDEIGSLDLFRSLPADALAQVRLVMRVERVGRDVSIFRQGDPVSRAYALGSGSVRIVQSGSDGEQAIVRFIARGEMFGTLSLFTDHQFPADAITVEASTVLTWSEADLLALMNRYPAIALNLVKVLGRRMAQLQDRVRELTTQRADQRIAQALLRLADQFGRDGARGTTIELPLRRKDLAGFAGTTLYTASRTISAWEKAGILGRSGQRVMIQDPDAIRHLAAGRDG